MIQLLIGPYRSGKTGRLLSELIAYKREHPLEGCLILVPSARYGNLLREQMVAKLGPNKGIFGVQISTVYEACEQVVRNSGIAPIILPRELCAEAVSNAITRLHERDELSHLKPIATMRGTASALSKLIDEFERAALTPSDVMTAVSTTGATSSKHHELAQVYKEYWQRLDELGATDQKRLAFTCREILSHARQGGWTGASNTWRMLLVDGFDRISPLQAEVMHALSQHAATTKISFDYVLPEHRKTDSDNANGDNDDEYSWKDSSFEELHSRFNVEPEIANASSPATTMQISGFRAIERFFETQEVARRCKAILSKGDIKPTNILVVARDISNYSGAVRTSFGEAGIPYFVDESIEHKNLPLTRFLLSLFSLSVKEFPRRQVIDCMRSPFFNGKGIGINQANIDALDRKSLDTGLLEGRSYWQTFLDKHCSEELGIKIDAFLELVTPPASRTAAGYCRWIEDRIDLLRKHAAARFADDLSATASTPELEALAGFRTALNTLLLKEQMFAQGELAYPVFFAELESVLEQSTFRRHPSTPEAVYVCSAEHAPNRRFDTLFILGTLEGDFPKHSGESGFLSADERAKWAMYGVKMTNPREEPGFEKALFKSLLERARKQVIVSAPCVDMSGDELFPSFFLTDGTLTLPSFARVDVCKQSLVQPTSPRDSISGWLWHKPGIEVADKMQAHNRISEFWDTVSGSLLGSWSRHQSRTPTAYNGYLVDLTESGWLKVKAPHALSASALNNYGQCPFKFWLTNMLSVRPREEPETGLTVQFKGSLFHKALELYYSRMAQIPPGQQADVKQEQLRSALADAVSELEEDSKFHPSPYWLNEQKELLFRLNRFIEFDEARLARDPQATKPALFEARFGMHKGESYPPLILKTANGAINIRGVIDRIDIQASDTNPRDMSVTVIDYKTGSTAITADDIAAFAQIQLPLYALAVQDAILPGAKVVSGQYLSVNAAKSTGSVSFTADKWSDLISDARAQITNSVEKIAKGDFEVRPYASKACTSCDHASICRVGDMKQFQFLEGE